MLKLEKKERSNDIAIRMIRQSRFTTLNFAIALFVALTIHVSSFFIFDISHLSILSSYPQYPPAHVATEISGSRGIDSALDDNEIDTKELLDFTTLAPPLHYKPELPKDAFASMRIPIYIDTDSQQPNITSHETDSFFSLEKFAIPMMVTFKPIEIRISGPAANSKVISKSLIGINEQQVADSRLLKHYRAIYSIIIEGDSGEIIWREIRQSTHHKKLNMQAEKILEEIRFESNNEYPFLEGLVELSFIAI